MAVEREELEALFNSPNNSVEDGRVKGYEDRINKSKEAIDELEQSISSNALPSILEDATIEDDVEDSDDEITLDDLIGSEDLNIETKSDKPKMIQEEIAIDELKSADNFDQPIIEEDDEEISLNDLLGDGSDKKEFKEELIQQEIEEQKKEKTISTGRIPLDFDFDEEKEEEEQVKVEIDITQKEEINNAELDEEKIVDKELNSDMSNVCMDFKYLKDPRYAEFYRQKLRAYNFLKTNVPQIDYDILREQLEDSHTYVNVDGVISLDKFNDKIQQVQSVRNRLTKLKSLCIQSYVPRKRVTKMLEDCLMKESPERSNDKRAGEIQIHMAEMEYELALADTFLKDVEQIMDNITSAHEALSRQITVLQERNKEIQRGQDPYIDNTTDRYDSVISKDDDEKEEDLLDINKKWKKIM